MTLIHQKKMKKIYVCYNPTCYQNALLDRYKSNTDRPIIFWDLFVGIVKQINF